MRKKLLPALLMVAIGCAIGCDESPSEPIKDTDGDGVTDGQDSCQFVKNPQQDDKDGDGIGDACDPFDDDDPDGDGVRGTNDNCPGIPNPGQEDDDGDGVGNACDGVDNVDFDGDGVSDALDNCRTTSNPNQEDRNANGVGDHCEDADGDLIFDSDDNCPDVSNPEQVDGDGDGVGRACQVVARQVQSTITFELSDSEARIDLTGHLEDDQGFERNECGAIWKWKLLENQEPFGSPQFSREVSFFTGACGTFSAQLNVTFRTPENALGGSEDLHCASFDGEEVKEVIRNDIVVTVCP